MTMVEAEATTLEIANRVDDLLTALPDNAPAEARQAISGALNAMRRAADVLADAAERRERPR